VAVVAAGVVLDPGAGASDFEVPGADEPGDVEESLAVSLESALFDGALLGPAFVDCARY